MTYWGTSTLIITCPCSPCAFLLIMHENKHGSKSTPCPYMYMFFSPNGGYNTVYNTVCIFTVLRQFSGSTMSPTCTTL